MKTKTRFFGALVSVGVIAIWSALAETWWTSLFRKAK